MDRAISIHCVRISSTLLSIEETSFLRRFQNVRDPALSVGMSGHVMERRSVSGAGMSPEEAEASWKEVHFAHAPQILVDFCPFQADFVDR